MKSIFLLLVLASSFMFANAQKIDECYINTKTGDTVLSTLWHNAEYSDASMLSFRFVRQNSKFRIELKYNFGKGPGFTVTKNDSIWVKFVEGWNITLFSQDSVSSQRGMASYPGSLKGVTTQGVYVFYDLSFIQVMTLQTQMVEKVRIFSSRGFDNILFSRDDRKALASQANVITNKIDQYPVISVSDEKIKAKAVEQKKDQW